MSTNSKVQISKLEDKTSNSSGAKTMADLMKSVKSNFVTLHKGGTVKGVITKVSPSEILADINAKSEALLLERDRRIMRYLLSVLKVGDKVEATVISLESEFGNPLISLRKFVEDIVWQKLIDAQKQKKTVEVSISELTKGGYLVNILENGLSGFLPQSYVTTLKNLQDVTGKKIAVYVVDLNKASKKVIFSQKPILETEEFEKITKNIKVGQKIDAIVSQITSFGVFVSLQISENVMIDGLVHISEISWEKVESIESNFKSGQKIEVVVIGIDKESKRIDLSIKRLTVDPFEKISQKFSVDQKVKGKVLEIQSSGVSIDLGEQMFGFIRREKIPPTVTYKVGQEVQASVSQIDKEKHRIILVPVLLEKPIGYR